MHIGEPSLFKKSRVRFHPLTTSREDSGYQGIAAYHSNSYTPKKKSKNRKLTELEKEYNKALAKESGQHDLAGGGRGVEADRAQHGAHALGEEGHGLLCDKVVKREFLPLIRQDRGPQVAVAADVHESLAVPAGVLDQGGPEHSLEAVEVSRAVVELRALSGFRKVRMVLGEPMLRALEIGLGGVPVGLGVEEAVEQPRLPPGVTAGIGWLEHLASPLHTHLSFTGIPWSVFISIQ